MEKEKIEEYLKVLACPKCKSDDLKLIKSKPYDNQFKCNKCGEKIMTPMIPILQKDDD